MRGRIGTTRLAADLGPSNQVNKDKHQNLIFLSSSASIDSAAASLISSEETKMAPGQKLYPRATVKKIVKAHSGCNVSKNVDVVVRLPTRLPPLPLTSSQQIFLDYVLFMQT